MLLENQIESIKTHILGRQYSLSVAFVSKKKSREINKKYRRKNRATNVLSFALRKNEGELVLCKAVIKKEAENIGKKYEKWLIFLVIHGMLHLKGMLHGSTMNRAEKKYYDKYDKKYFSRNRRGVIHDASRGRRVRKGRKKS